MVCARSSTHHDRHRSKEQFHDSPSYLLHSSKMISRIIESVEGDIGLNDIVDTKVFPGNLGWVFLCQHINGLNWRRFIEKETSLWTLLSVCGLVVLVGWMAGYLVGLCVVWTVGAWWKISSIQKSKLLFLVIRFWNSFRFYVQSEYWYILGSVICESLWNSVSTNFRLKLLELTYSPAVLFHPVSSRRPYKLPAIITGTSCKIWLNWHTVPLQEYNLNST